MSLGRRRRAIWGVLLLAVAAALATTLLIEGPSEPSEQSVIRAHVMSQRILGPGWRIRSSYTIRLPVAKPSWACENRWTMFGGDLELSAQATYTSGARVGVLLEFVGRATSRRSTHVLRDLLNQAVPGCGTLLRSGMRGSGKYYPTLLGYQCSTARPRSDPPAGLLGATIESSGRLVRYGNPIYCYYVIRHRYFAFIEFGGNLPRSEVVSVLKSVEGAL